MIRLPDLREARIVAVPTLDEIAANPGTAGSLTAEIARALLARCMMVQSALLVPALAGSVATETTVSADDDEWISLDEASRILGGGGKPVSRRWFARRKGKLPFVKKLSERTFVVSKKGLFKWLAAKTA
jgi:hypothetical protein